MNRWIAEFELEDGDTMPEHMDLEYKGARIDFHCKPLEQEPTTKNDLAVDKTFYEQIVEYCNEHFLVLVEKDVWEDAEKALTTKKDLGVDAVSRQAVLELIADYDLSMGQVVKGIHALPSVTPQEPFINKPCVSEKVCEHDKQMVLEKINKMKSEIADSLEFWDYSPSNNPLARDMLETLTNFLGDMREVEE